jgi:hypothetical protein
MSISPLSRFMPRSFIAPVCALLVLAAFADSASALSWYSRGHGRAPHGDRVSICHGYSCRLVTPVRFTPAEIAKIAGPLVKGVPDAAAERKALSGVVQRFEVIVGAHVGTSGDLPRMQFGRAKPDQMDCIDEATNTTSLLLFLTAHGYLKHHDVLEPAQRGFFLDGRYPHATAVLSVKGTRAKWAIDSWPRANGEPPVIQPLPVWRRDRHST